MGRIIIWVSTINVINNMTTTTGGRGHFSTVKSPGTAAPSHAKNREIAKGGSETREIGTGGSREKPVNKGLRTIK